MSSVARDKIRVCFVIPSLRRGGAEGQVLELLRRLDRDRFAPSLVVFSNFDDSFDSRDIGANVLFLDIPAENYSASPLFRPAVTGLIRLQRLLTEGRPEIVHSVLPAAAILGTFASVLARVPVKVIGLRSLTGSYRRKPLLTLVEKLSLKMADALVANCTAIADETVASDHVPARKVFTIHNGVDTGRFQPASGLEIRRKLGWDRNHLVVGIVANFFPYKRHIDFVHAAAILRDRQPSARFLMIGRDAGTLPQVRSEIERRQLAPVTHILSGIAPEELYSAMDIIVSTSESEGLSNVLLEAMACAKPVVATIAGGNIEVVEDGLTGALVPIAAPHLTAAAVERLITDPRLRQQLGASGRLWAQTRFSMPAMVRRYEELYAALVTQRSPVHIDDRKYSIPA